MFYRIFFTRTGAHFARKCSSRGFTPAVSLIEVTGNRAIARLGQMFAAACGFLATWLAYRSRPQVAVAAVSRAGLSSGG